MTTLMTWLLPDCEQVVAWCEACGKWHFHGAGGRGADVMTFGYRAPHCAVRSDGNYLLLKLGRADEAVVEVVHRGLPPPDLEAHEWACVARAVALLHENFAELARRLA